MIIIAFKSVKSVDGVKYVRVRNAKTQFYKGNHESSSKKSLREIGDNKGSIYQHPPHENMIDIKIFCYQVLRIIQSLSLSKLKVAMDDVISRSISLSLSCIY